MPYSVCDGLCLRTRVCTKQGGVLRSSRRQGYSGEMSCNTSAVRTHSRPRHREEERSRHRKEELHRHWSIGLVLSRDLQLSSQDFNARHNSGPSGLETGKMHGRGEGKEKSRGETNHQPLVLESGLLEAGWERGRDVGESDIVHCVGRDRRRRKLYVDRYSRLGREIMVNSRLSQLRWSIRMRKR